MNILKQVVKIKLCKKCKNINTRSQNKKTLSQLNNLLQQQKRKDIIVAKI